MHKARIGILDSFRALAIVAVLLFHFFSRSNLIRYPDSFYPGDKIYGYIEYGYLGVPFFFMISGFVIFYTLENTRTLAEFWKKRLIRLMPSLIIATVLTYLFSLLFDKDTIFPTSHSIENFLPSLTFITPDFFKEISSHFAELDYINGSFWSLWLEIQFYFFVSLLYFASRKRFSRNFLIMSFGMILIHSIFMNIIGSNRLNMDPHNPLVLGYVRWIRDIFNLVEYLPMFVVGALFYTIFKSRRRGSSTPVYLYFCLGIIMLFQIHSVLSHELRIIYLAMFGLFGCFVYFPAKLAFLNNRFLIRIGGCSYFLYLIHEHVGLIIIYYYSHYFKQLGFTLPLILIILLIVLSIKYTEKIDRKLNTYLKKKLLKTVK